MAFLRECWNRLRSFFHKDPLDRDLDAEMRSHLEMAIEENLARGLSQEEARRQALIRFGGFSQARERHRESRGIPGLDALLQDLRYTLRTLRRDRGFTAIAVLILALGIGANVAVFSVVDRILLRPLPFQNANRLVWIAANNGVGGLSDTTFRVDSFDEYQHHNQSFESVAGYVPFFSVSDTKLTGQGEPRMLSEVWVTGNLFPMLGVKPEMGRLFAPEECILNARHVALLSHPFFLRQFHGDRSILGKVLTLNNTPTVVVGVLPDTFDFGSVFHPGMKFDVFVPAITDSFRTWGHMLSMVGVLKPGVTLTQAQAEADTVFPQLKATHPEWQADFSLHLTGLKEYVSGRLERALVVLWCAVGMILLIVCVNLSNLLLARSAARAKEFAMRSALGAGRGRLVRQLLTESLVLSGAGALLGLGFAYATTFYLAHQGSIALPLMSSVRVDGTALAWTVLIAVSAAVLFGLAPAFRNSDRNLQDALKDSGHGTSTGWRHGRLRAVLVVSEVALACILLVGAGLLLRSFLRVLEVDLGFEPSHAAAIKADFNDDGNAAKRGAILQQMLNRVSSIPGIEAAGMSDKLPLDRNRSWDLSAKGRAYPKDANHDAFVYIVTPGYLNAMGMHLRRGRDISWSDSSTSQHVIVINEAAARRDWPGEDPIGKLAEGIGQTDSRVVGVVADVHESGVEDPANPEVFAPAMQDQPESMELVVRTSLPPSAMAASVMDVLRALNPTQPAAEFRPVQQLVDRSISPRRFFVLLVSIFAALGLVLASLGIYGVISYSVAQQTQEIGIRMALGATQSRVRSNVLWKTLRLTLFGIGIGAVASIEGARAIASLLYGTAPGDPETFAITIAVLIAVALLAGYLPARRASRIDPMIALRNG